MPSPEVLANQGVQAVNAGRYKEGIEKLSEALKERPAPLWLLERSKAHLRTDDLDLALYDAEKALRVAFDRANRDLMIESQIRRAVTYFRMKKYADADICAYWAIRLIDGARATEDDGQQNRVDQDGSYSVTAKEVSDQNTPSDKQAGVTAAMGNSRTKETRLKNQAFSWRLQALTQLEKLPKDDPGRKVGISLKYPDPKEPLPKKSVQPTAQAGAGTGKEGAVAAGSQPANRTTWEGVWDEFRAIHAKNNIRSSFYQTESTVNVDFFVKNVPKDVFRAEAQSRQVVLQPVPGAHNGRIQLFLSDEIKPEETKYTVKSMKIELVLKKATLGKWSSLRRENAEIIDNIALPNSTVSLAQFQHFVTSQGYETPNDLQVDASASADDWYQGLVAKLTSLVETGNSSTGHSNSATGSSKPTNEYQVQKNTSNHVTEFETDLSKEEHKVEAASKPSERQTGPSYPTSSKKGPRNWDKFDDPDEDADDQKDGGGDVNSFFQQLYKNADEDTKRAMMKSYVESNGTSLSTSWAEAKEKKYETMPPDGAEAKKWDK